MVLSLIHGSSMPYLIVIVVLLRLFFGAWAVYRQTEAFDIRTIKRWASISYVRHHASFLYSTLNLISTQCLNRSLKIVDSLGLEDLL